MFEQVPDAKVKIAGIRALKDYLRDHVRFWNGRKVLGFTTFGTGVKVRVEAVRGYLTYDYGNIDDVAHNIQMGFYEGG